MPATRMWMPTAPVSTIIYHLIQPQHKYCGDIQSRVECAQRENPKCKVRKDSVKFIDSIPPELLGQLNVHYEL